MQKKYYDKIYPIDKNKLNRNRWLFIKEGLRRGYYIKRIHPKKLIFYVEKDDKGFIYDTLPGAVTSRMRFPHIMNKIFHKQCFIESNISIAQTFAVVNKNDDLDEVNYKFPCVVKPIVGSLSKNVFGNIQTEQSLKEALKQIVNNNSVAVVEEYVHGREYRILAINGKFVSCVQRCSASVVGDGVHTVKELIEIKNTDPLRGPRDSSTYTLHHIIIDEELKNILKQQKIILDDVIKKDELVNLGTKVASIFGGDIIDRTNEIHRSFVIKCEQFVQRYNFFIIGFDVIAEDISKNATEQKYIFNELNEQPFFDVNEKCNIGTGPLVASIMWDEIEKSAIMTEKFLLF